MTVSPENLQVWRKGRVVEVGKDSGTFFSKSKNIKERPYPKGSESRWAEATAP